MRNSGQAVAEDGELPRVHRDILVRAGQVTEQGMHVERLHGRIGQFLGRDAEAVYAAVDHQVAGTAPRLAP